MGQTGQTELPMHLCCPGLPLKALIYWLLLIWLAMTGSAAIGGEQMQISATAFDDGGEIPRRYTCQGEDRSPELHFSGVPADARSLVLIVDDPDAPDPAAPKMTWVHWLLYNLPPTSKSLPTAVADLPAGTLAGLNDWQRTGYGGPCPPIGRHRYFFKLYALDLLLDDLKSPDKPALLAAIEGHVIAQATLIGRYQKQ